MYICIRDVLAGTGGPHAPQLRLHVSPPSRHGGTNRTRAGAIITTLMISIVIILVQTTIIMILVMVALVAHAQERALLCPRCASFANAYLSIYIYIYIHTYTCIIYMYILMYGERETDR